MKNFFTTLRLGFLASLMLLTASIFGQTKVAGKVSDGYTKEALIGVSFAVKGKVVGTISDAKGNFSLSTNTPTPFTIAISSVGYQTQELVVTGSKTDIDIKLEEQNIMGQEVVVAASRVEESVMKSPVAVEKMDIRAIKESAAPSFYDAIANIKGVDMTTQGVLFKSINMRGFNATGNPRTVQMIDGMDNSAPGLNFPTDNIVGMPELDVESVELLPGAASALYGPNAISGLILMNSKSPFLYQGLSAAVKTGIMTANNRSTATTPFYDFSMRYAKSINDKLAYKVNFAYITAQDWQSTNYTNLNIGGNADPTRATADTDYDGVNTYGDETRRAVGGVGVTRTGLLEKDIADYNTKSFKTNVALHYRFNERMVLIGQVNYGIGTTVYTGTGKYALRNFSITQAKLELKADNFTLRAYTTQERSGDSYAVGLTALSMQRAVKSDNAWFQDYTTKFNATNSHSEARKFADTGMPAPGTDAFNSLLETARAKAIVDGGGNFLDKTNMYHAEGFYNFKNQIKFIELLAGANYRQYQLRSAGTLFSDTKEGRDGTISINEYGAFLQAGKSLFNDHLKLSGSIRYDKSQNYDGQYTPRLSAVTTFGESNVRLSYQTGFRIPTTQNQYIDLATPLGTLIGGQPEFDARYKLNTGILRENLSSAVIADLIAKDPTIVQAATQYATAAVTQQATATITQQVTAAVTAGVTAQVNAAVAAGQLPAAQAAAAIQAGVAAALPAQLQGALAQNLPGILKAQVPALVTQLAPAFALAKLPKYQSKTLQPERIASYEIGYKGLIAKKLFVDAYYYYSKYTNFIGGTTIVVPTAAAAPGLPIESGIGSGLFNGYSRPANTSADITASGWAIGLNYALAKGYSVGGNFASNQLDGFTSTPEQPYAGYNTPKNRYNVNFGKKLGSGDKVGFNVTLRYQDSFTWESSFVQPSDATQALFTNTQVPSITNLDAQVSIKVPSIKSIVKIGGTNIGGTPYIQAYGSALVGSMYYVSLSFDELLNK